MDRFGYYTVGNLKFYSRLEAFETAKRLNLGKVTWHFNDEVFSSYDWTVEPSESLEEVYRQRAQEIRDKYDYVVLMFSSGADSTNILNAFLDNNIKLDELVSRVNYEGLGDKETFMNGEIFHNAIPMASAAKERQPHLIHTLIDAVPYVTKLLKDPETKFNWMYEQNLYLGLNVVAHKLINETQKHWTDLVTAGKKVVFVHGIDKPCVVGTEKNGYHMFFRDMIDQAVSPAMQIANDESKGFCSEYFYWAPTPAAVKLLMKQGHVLKRVLKTIDLTAGWTAHWQSSMVSSVRNKKPFYLYNNGINREVYPKWQKVGWQIKPPSLLYSWRDDFYHKLSDWDEDKKWWKSGVEHLWNTMPEHMRKDPNNMYMGYKPMNSKHYYLGK